MISDLQISLKRAGIGFAIGSTLGGADRAAYRTGLCLFGGSGTLPDVVATDPCHCAGADCHRLVRHRRRIEILRDLLHSIPGRLAEYPCRSFCRRGHLYPRRAVAWRQSLPRVFFEVVVPAAAPHIVVGLRLGAALAFLSLVAAELSGASSGIGFRLQDARQFIQTDRMFVGLIELGILGALLDSVFVIISRRLVHWESA
ncbi:ABC transporter permease subunit [Roseibium salinum]|nr:ABC transporter permease subunit [Roseibium salinum]